MASTIGATATIRLNLFPNCMANMSGIQRELVGLAMDYAVQVEQQNVPIETGSLHDSIVAIPAGEGGIVRAGGGTRRVTGEPLDYAGFQEYGTIYNAAHPFVRPAIDATANQIVGIAGGMGIEDRLIS